MKTNLITVTAQIGKCIYHIEMQTKNTLAEILSEVAVALEVPEKSIKIIRYGKAHENSN